MTDRDKERLAGCHPFLISAISQVLSQMSAAGYPMFVVVGLRSDAEEEALYAQGRTRPGPRVTNTDGIIYRSNHQANLIDHLGHAVDCAFVGGDPFGPKQPWGVYGKAVVDAGLKWGGSWSTFHDLPHAEMPEGPNRGLTA